VAFERIDREPVDPEPVGAQPGHHEFRRSAARRLGTGTLACPVCDAPAAPPVGVLAPSDPLGCGFCSHSGAVRDFLSLAEPSRPTRVEVRVVRAA
jgi:hypothetical protein